MALRKIISGGQTGVDRAALDAAIALNLPHGGWCPAGRLAEDGIIPDKYCLSETNSRQYQERTLLNVCDSDMSLIIIQNKSWGKGTLYTKQVCIQQKKKFVLHDVSLDAFDSLLEALLPLPDGTVLNLAGNRESTTAGIYNKSYQLFLRLFMLCRQ